MAVIQFGQYNALIRQAFQDNGLDARVRRRDLTEFDTKVFERRYRGTELTEGLTQQDYRVRVIASDWDRLAGGPPEKGDQVTISGRRHAVESWQRHALADQYYLLLHG
ncbi:MAG: hypothetical protein ACK2UO_02115 [Caldilineaceae bacterium]